MVAKFCSRSHGHPVFGVRSAAMISRRRPISREGVIDRVLLNGRGPYQTFVLARSRRIKLLDGRWRADGVSRVGYTLLGRGSTKRGSPCLLPLTSNLSCSL